MNLQTVGLTLFLTFGLATTSRAVDKPLTLDVWPGKVPGETGTVGEEKWLEPKPNEKQVKRLTNVTKPTLTVFRPATDKDTGAAVLIAPGGGYNILAWDLEGEEVAAWLNSIGVTGIVLKYRVPRRPGQPKDQPPPGPLQDAQRALSLVRSKAKEWGIHPDRIGMMGFSAGAHLTASLSNNYEKRAYEPMDDIDQVSCRPDFALVIYPGLMVTGPQNNQLRPEVTVTAKTPRTFLVQTQDDAVKVESSLYYYLALKNARVPAELHLYPTGGHGYGLRPSAQTVSTWPQRAEQWMRSLGVLERKK
jgi:acetyl esterase/lipase